MKNGPSVRGSAVKRGSTTTSARGSASRRGTGGMGRGDSKPALCGTAAPIVQQHPASSSGTKSSSTRGGASSSATKVKTGPTESRYGSKAAMKPPKSMASEISDLYKDLE